MKCYICGSGKIVLVSGKLRYKTVQKAYKCLKCGLVFLYPKMNKVQEKKFYEKEYGIVFSKEKGTTPEDLFNARQNDAAIYYELTKKFIKKSCDCLEIGCASGYFLNYIKNKVNSISGIESHILLRGYCEKIGVKIFDDTESIKNKKFDIIFMFFVVEHLSDPIKFFSKLKGLLKKNGKIIVEVPNVEDALLTLYDIPAFKQYYFTPAHSFYYSKKTLALLFKKVGYQKFNIEYLQRYDLSNHMYWMMYGKPGGLGKFNNVFSEKLRLDYKIDLMTCGRSDTLFAVISI